MHPDKPENVLRRVNHARNFPVNTCGASRHVAAMGEALAAGRPYLMLAEDPKYCAGSMLATVAALWEARLEIAQLKSQAVAYASEQSECSDDERQESGGSGDKPGP